jgi:Bacterial inner membrane protein
MQTVGQIIGIIGFAFSIIAFLQKRDNHMRNYLGVSSTIVSISYYLTGAYAGAFIILISAIRNFVSARQNTQKLFPVFIIANILVGIYSYKDFYDIFPVLGVLASTISVFRLKDIHFRIGMLIACALWLVYNIITFSIGPMMMEAFNIVALSYAIYRIKKGVSG